MVPEVKAKAWLETEKGEKLPIVGLCTFGRVRANTVVLPTPKVSRQHAIILEQNGEFWLVDLGSTNGLQINGERVTRSVLLHAGDRIQLPSSTFKFGMETTRRTEVKTASGTLTTQHQVTQPEMRTEKCWLLLADLQGFAKMSQQLTAGELAPLIGKWMVQCQEILRVRKGELATFLGDGFLAYWTDRGETVPPIAAACRDFEELKKATTTPFRLVVHYGEVSFRGRAPDGSIAMMGPELNFTYRLEKVASRLKLRWIFSEPAAGRLRGHLELSGCGAQRVPDFEPERECFTLGG